MNRPFVPMFRDLFDTPIWKDINCWRVYCYLCYRAAHKEVSLTAHTGRGSTVVKLQKGQVLFGRISAAKECGMTESAVRSAISKLERLGAISQKPATHYSVVTICDTMAYEYDSPTISQPTASQLPTNYHKQEYKDNREGKEEIHTGDSVESPKRSVFKVDADKVERIYAEYPRKESKQQGLKAIAKAITKLHKQGFALNNQDTDYIDRVFGAAAVEKLSDPYFFLFVKTKRYAILRSEKPEEEKQFTPHPATWYNSERYFDI